MGKLATFLAVLALGAAGWAAFTLKGLRDDLTSIHRDVEVLAPLESRIAALESAARDAAPPPPALRSAPRTPEGEPSLLAPSPRPASSPAGGTTGSTATTHLEVLEKRLAALEEKASAANAVDDAMRTGSRLARLGNTPGFYATPEDAARELELDAAQKSDLERITEAARRELDDLRKLPDEDGASYEQIQKDMFEGARGGGLRLDLGKMLSWSGKVIPGRNETFGAASQRIRDNAKSSFRRSLRPDQQAKLDKANVDPLFHGNGPGMVMSFSTVDVVEPPPAGR